MAPSRVRKVEIVAQDPSVRRGAKVVTSVISIPFEPLDRGPMGYAVHVVDYDASTASFYAPAVMPDRDVVRAPRTLPALLEDPAYHAFNVYAIVMRTLGRFEFALGRRVGWGVRGHQLKVVPHAFEEANAFYSPTAEALMFGYARTTPPVFLCLSHDVVVHETAHALLDGLRDRFMTPSSADQAALHEAFADIVALLSVFSLDDVLGHLLDLTVATAADDRVPRGMIRRSSVTESMLRRSVLLGLAEEMRDANGDARVNALRRSVEIPPDPHLLESAEFDEEHRRGEVVVAAFLRAFVRAWSARVERLGSPGGVYVDRALVAEQGATIADLLLTMAIRAIDYTPPIHIRFGDFLSALITADCEVRVDDTRYDLRGTLLRTFAEFGILPGTRGEDRVVPGAWDRAPEALDRTGLHLVSLQNDETEMFRLVWRNRKALGLHPNAFTRICSVRPCLRVSPDDGFQLRETVVELTQYVRVTGAQLADLGLQQSPGMTDETEFSIEGGATLVLDEYGELKFVISNSLPSRSDRPEKREKQQHQLDYLWAHGFLTSRTRLSGRLAELHTVRTRGAAFGARELPEEAWT